MSTPQRTAFLILLELLFDLRKFKYWHRFRFGMSYIVRYGAECKNGIRSRMNDNNCSPRMFWPQCGPRVCILNDSVVCFLYAECVCVCVCMCEWNKARDIHQNHHEHAMLLFNERLCLMRGRSLWCVLHLSACVCVCVFIFVCAFLECDDGRTR